LHKKEIISIQTKIKQKKLTIVPTKVYTKGRLIKVEITLAKAKRKFEKKEQIKKKDIEREIERELKG
jgi:SsrA-binding protein